jgi:uncharacterized membrane protein YphA (DoxX/SURF4 family)
VRYALALALAVLFAWAGAAKLVDAAGTRTTMAALGVPAPRVVALALPVIELAVAAALVVEPAVGAVAAIATLAAFTVFLVGRIRAGVTVPCRCFGAASTAPVGWATVARNGALAAVAVAVLAGA